MENKKIKSFIIEIKNKKNKLLRQLRGGFYKLLGRLKANT